jgi:hypothetical protein
MSTTADRSGVFGVSIADYRLNFESLALPKFPQTSWRRSEPDLGLIKQVEQVKTVSSAA